MAGTGAPDAFLTPATIRQPAEGLGPRAQLTISGIIDATREVFLTRGYAGTTIDEIARVADVSRASFYTYFPSKREVLLAVGADAAGASAAIIATLSERSKNRVGMVGFVFEYFAMLDVHGSFAFAWTQAAREDEEIRVAGMKRHLGLAKLFGMQLATSAGRVAEQPAVLGIVASSMLERSWDYSQLYADTVDRSAIVDEAARSLFAMARAQT
jgi:AcrR family transcriptional regulator